MTLGTLAIVTLMVVAFAVSMRVEMMASRNFNDAIRARQFADAGVAEAIAILRTNTPVLSTNSFYVTQPGRAIANPSPSCGGQLYSRDLVSLSPQSTNINYDGSIDSGLADIWINWLPITNTTGNLVGRFCYWVDDEASKLNINATNIDLSVLGIDSTAAANYATSTGFATTASLPLASGVSVANYTDNKFYLTAYSVDTNLTPWGDVRLNLNRSDIAGVTNYGGRTNAISLITNALENASITNWFGQTFADKYDNVQQIAANILDFVTTNNVPTDSADDWESTTAPSCLGLKETPYLSEILNSNVLSVTESSGQRTISLDVYTQVELWNMYATAWTNSGNAEIFVSGMPLVTFVNTNLTTGFVTSTNVVMSSFTISLPSSVDTNYTPFPTTPRHDSLYTGTYDTNSITTITYGSNVVTAILREQNVGRIDYAQVPVAPKTGEDVVTNSELNVFTPTDGDVRARISEVNDPRVKPVSYNWFALTNGVGSMGSNNASAFNAVVTIGGIQSDGDISSHYYVKRGALSSVGELGYIHTGYPWRTLRLQPQNGESSPPDWLVLDLFSTTDSGSVTGRININAHIYDFNGASSTADRSRSLYALTNATFSVAAANNIYDWVWASTTWPPSTPAFFTNDVYAFIGEVCEVDQVANAGSDDENKEERVRSIADLITTRSDTFTVWAWGQALQEIKSGGVVIGTNVVGEAKVQAVVQRGANNQYRVLYYRYLNP